MLFEFNFSQRKEKHLPKRTIKHFSSPQLTKSSLNYSQLQKEAVAVGNFQSCLKLINSILSCSQYVCLSPILTFFNLCCLFLLPYVMFMHVLCVLVWLWQINEEITFFVFASENPITDSEGKFNLNGFLLFKNKSIEEFFFKITRVQLNFFARKSWKYLLIEKFSLLQHPQPLSIGVMSEGTHIFNCWELTFNEAHIRKMKCSLFISLAVCCGRLKAQLIISHDFADGFEA